MKNHTSIEPLEPRIAPAAITILGKTATWTDHDGDLVTMKWTSIDAPAFTTMNKGEGLLVSRVFLESAKHDGASVTIAVKRAGAFGDGRIDLGHLDAFGVALKSWVSPTTNISEIDVGNLTNAVETLVIGSYGQTRVTEFIGAMGDSQGSIRGNTKLVKINGDVGFGLLGIFPGASQHGDIIITGDLHGDSSGGNSFDGYFSIFGSAKNITIGGSVANGTFSQLGGDLKSLTIGGDIINKDAPLSSNGYVVARVEKFTLRGSVIGGQVYITNPFPAPVKSVFIGGSIVARDGFQNSGIVSVSSSKETTITVKGSIVGGEMDAWTNSNTPSSFDVTYAGAIVAEGSVGAINVGGSIYGGTIKNSDPAVNGGIAVRGNLGKLAIKGSVTGFINDPVFIMVQGTTNGVPAGTPAIGKVSIKGNATYAYIAAGSVITHTTQNAPQVFSTTNELASIGSVFVGGNYANSNIFAGVQDGGFLGVNNTPTFDTLTGGDSLTTGRLGPVVIKGYLISDREPSFQSGFAANSIASITVHGRKVFTAGDALRNFDTFITAKEL